MNFSYDRVDLVFWVDILRNWCWTVWSTLYPKRTTKDSGFKIQHICVIM